MTLDLFSRMVVGCKEAFLRARQVGLKPRQTDIRDEENAHQLHLELEIESREAVWSYEKREVGVKAQRSDRSQWKEFLEELLTFKPRA